MFWCLQRDFLSLIREFSGGKLKQKGFFHSVRKLQYSILVSGVATLPPLHTSWFYYLTVVSAPIPRQVKCLKFVVLSSKKAAIFHPRFRSGYNSSTPYFLVLTSHHRFSSYSWAAEVLEVCLPLLPKKAAIFHPRFRSGYPSSIPYFLVLTSHRRFSSYSWAGEVLKVCRPLLQESCNISSRFRSSNLSSIPYLELVLTSHRRFNSYSWAAEVLDSLK